MSYFSRGWLINKDKIASSDGLAASSHFLYHIIEGNKIIFFRPVEKEMKK